VSGPGAFEKGLAELEDRVRRLEHGDLPLEEALRLYEEGVALARGCHEALDAVEKRLAVLSRGPDGIAEEALPEEP
jgi:exodeoxyribonuclease VII small subunit